MSFPQGGDFAREVASLFNILKVDKRGCVNDNGTTVCNSGHKLKYPGTCYNQQAGSFNSTDEAFQPTYPVCISDYKSAAFHPMSLPATGGATGNLVSASLVQGVSGVFMAAGLLSTVERSFAEYMFGGSKSGSTFFQRVIYSVASTLLFRSAPTSVLSAWTMTQFNPGELPHLPDVYSDLYVYDVFSGFSTYNRLVVNMLESRLPSLRQTGVLDSLKNLVSTDYYTTISGQDDMCVGDGVSPQITLHSPSISGALLRPQNQQVDFSLADPVGGVDLSTVYVSIDSTVSGTIPLLEAGVDQTSGELSVTGDSRSYRITYTPTFTWSNNEYVVVSVSGSDLPPQVDGNPFYCGAQEVNEFVGDIPFKILNDNDLATTLTAVGDTEPPTITTTVPASGTGGNSVFTPIYIGLTDNLTGVDLSSLFVSVGGAIIVQDGSPTTSEAGVHVVPGGYLIYYSRATAYTYDSAVEVIVNVADLVDPVPNQLNASYYISFIGDSSLVIENFIPPAGTSTNTEILDVSVDIRDDAYGVDGTQCFFVVNGTVISGTQSPLASGVNISYHPTNDFISETPIRVLVHAVNANAVEPVVKEALYTLYPGYRVVHYNDVPYRHDTSVEVFVGARNTELLHQDLSTGYFFTAYTQPQADLGAEIVAINPVADLSATLTPVVPQHVYGQTVTVTFYVSDTEGHALGPYNFTYTIEDRPE